MTPGIVHIGPGAFHRAHQAAYVDAILPHDPRWGISAVALNSTGVADALGPQDGLYTLALLGETVGHRVIGSMVELLTAGRRDAILSRIAAPTTRLVSTTVTEKGYHLDAGGALDMEHPAIIRELTGAEPSTLSGWLVAGLAARRAAGGGAITLMACDNLADNGRRFRRSVRDLAAARDPDLAAWIDDHVRFPSTMVDLDHPGDRRRAAPVGRCGHRPRRRMADPARGVHPVGDRGRFRHRPPPSTSPGCSSPTTCTGSRMRSCGC
ncbi:hypothetical protein [Sphingomonas hankookensis]|uniref:hypothetical protein n=1 Tax=Sphingomonas hankookensis TaxID=563996 RepID=UPI003D3026C3